MLSIMEKRGIEVKGKEKAILLGGGSKSTVWSQILSDVLGIELRKLESVDASFGSALIGGVGVSLFESPQQAVQKCVRISKTMKPDSRNHSLYMKQFVRYKKIHDALAEIYREM
jgi:xylulokinase